MGPYALHHPSFDHLAGFPELSHSDTLWPLLWQRDLISELSAILLKRAILLRHAGLGIQVVPLRGLEESRIAVAIWVRSG